MAVTTININSLLGAVLYSHTEDNNSFSKALKAFFNAKRGEIIEYLDCSNQQIELVDFSNITFFGAKFSNTAVSKSIVQNATFYQCNLTGSTWSNSVYFNVTYKKTLIKDATFCNSQFRNIQFTCINFDTVTLRGNTIINTKFTDCTFTGNTFTQLSFDSLTIDQLIAINQLSLLDGIKADFHSILSHFTVEELSTLRQRLVEGRIDGNTYEGVNANLLGTLANLRSEDYRDLSGITPDFYRSGEVWFLLIKVGDTQENSSLVDLTIQWIDN
jgi:hypothetical protein